jgi:hypothetical protein
MIDELCGEIKSEFPGFQLKTTKFLTNCHIIIGHTVYVPTSWKLKNEIEKCVILRHERVHMRQAREYGQLLFIFLYFVPFFPIGLAYWRTKFEKEAYEESIYAKVKMEGTYNVLTKEYRKTMLSNFFSSKHGWMWGLGSRKSIENWFNQSLEKAILSYIGKPNKSNRIVRVLIKRHPKR